MPIRPRTLKELAVIAGASIEGDEACLISAVSTLSDAGPGTITFLTKSNYRNQLADTHASAVILKPDDLSACPTNALVTENPHLAYARVAACFSLTENEAAGIDAQATVDPEAEIDPTAFIGPGSIVEAGARVGPNVSIGPNCVVGKNVVIGRDTRLVASVTLCRDVVLGVSCLIHPGAVIGSDGFGFANDAGAWIKVAQLGSVRIGNNVEIGANTTIDRGAVNDTVIHDGVKLDNLIQVAHNVVIGEHTAIAACAGISGSTKIGKHCTLAGGVGIVGHVELADNVHVTGMSMVSKSLTQPGVYGSGTVAVPQKEWQKSLIRIKQLDKMAQRLKQLEIQLAELLKKQ